MKLAAIALTLIVTAGPLAALDLAAAVAKLGQAEWVEGEAHRDRGLPLVVLVIATAAPGTQQTAVEVGTLRREQRERLQAVALSSDPIADLQAFRTGLGLEMGYPLGRLPAAELAAFTADARGLPHCLLIGADDELLWQGHPRLLPQVVAAKLP